MALGTAFALALPATAGAQTGGGASGDPRTDERLVSGITITRAPDAQQGECVPRSGGLSYEALHGTGTFTLRITAPAPLCEPVTARAAIYAMPGGGVPWPQELVEFSEFTIAEAGTIDVVFTKGCDPVQFDVLTGDTPQTVAPWGEWHGPLLFPFDIDTTHQHWGAECEAPAPTTTTAVLPPTAPPPEMDTTTSTTTTTTEPEVLSVSEETPPRSDEPVVLAAGQVPAGEPANLALTGLGFRVLAVAAATLLLAGGVLTVLGRRRSAA